MTTVGIIVLAITIIQQAIFQIQNRTGITARRTGTIVRVTTMPPTAFMTTQAIEPATQRMAATEHTIISPIQASVTAIAQVASSLETGFAFFPVAV